MSTLTPEIDSPIDTSPPETAASTGGRRYGLATLVAAVVASLLAGFAIGMVTLQPAPTPGESSPEAGFARDMIIHHAQAVEMGMIAYDRAELVGVRQIGYDIATMQQSQIGMMDQWLRDWKLNPTGSDLPMAWMPDGDLMAGYPMPGMASQEEMEQLRSAEGLEVDRLFLELMITHHLGGIHMVEGVLELSDHEEVLWLAGMMKDGQQRELVVLRALLEDVEAQAAES
jgi:uncharacterized protein (DUF305 family)